MARSKKSAKKSGKQGNSKQEFDNSNRGVLWQNDDKNSDKSPDYRGNVKIVVDLDDIIDNGDGTATIHRYLSAWDAVGESCGDYLSLSVGKAVPETHGDPDEEE